MTIICGLTKNYTQIFLARIGVGVGEATLTPSTTSLIGDYFPREDVPLAMSIFQAGPIIGTGIAFIVGGFVLQLVEGASPGLPIIGELVPGNRHSSTSVCGDFAGFRDVAYSRTRAPLQKVKSKERQIPRN